MFLIYHVLVLLLLPVILTVLLVKLLRRQDYLTRFSERFGKVRKAERSADAPVKKSIEHQAEPRFWLHAVSAGEVAAAVPMIAALRARYPRSHIVVSTLTPAGRAMLAASSSDADQVFYCPIDAVWVVRRVVEKIDPSLFIVVETDLWPALLHCLARRQVPTVLVNGRISLRRVRFRYLFRPVFALLDHICVQTQVDAERLANIGVGADKLSVTGNLKFAQALGQIESPPPADPKLRLPKGAALLIAGSTHSGEEEEIIECYRKLREHQRDVFLLVAPRHLERLETIEELICRRGYACQRWSLFDGWRCDQIALLDSVGNLPRLYSLANFVFVGGSFAKRGGHNLLEPAAWGKPIFFGPNMENYSSIAETTERENAAIRVQNGLELAAHIERLCDAPQRAEEMGKRARELVTRNQGVVERNLAIIEGLLQAEPARKPARPCAVALTSKRILPVVTLCSLYW